MSRGGLSQNGYGNTYTCETELIEMTKLKEAAEDSSVMRHKMNESDKLWTEWKQNLCCEHFDDAVDLCENAISHDFGAILENGVPADDGTNVARATCRSCLDMLISVTRTIGFILILKFAYLKRYVSSEINRKSTYGQCNYVKLDDLVYFAGDTVEMDSAEHAVGMPKVKDYFDYVKDLSCVAAFCSDLPEIETNDVWQAGIRHETDDDKDTDDEYRKDSGRTGCFENFKSTFQMTNAFPSPEIGKTKENVKTRFSALSAAARSHSARNQRGGNR